MPAAEPARDPLPTPPGCATVEPPLLAGLRRRAGTALLLERSVVLLLCAGLLLGVLAVLRPFTTAILFGAILAIASWPLRTAMMRRGLGRATVASLLLLAAVGVLLVPLLALAPSIGDRVATGAQQLQAYLSAAPEAPPEWLRHLPVIGDRLERLWSDAVRADGDLSVILQPYADGLRRTLVAIARALADSLVQLVLSLIVATMFWSNGDTLANSLRDILRRLGGEPATQALQMAGGAVRGVAYGIVGTAVLQATAMGLGLMVAGVPGAAMLGLAALLLALSQIGAVLIAVIGFGAAWWLFRSGAEGWGSLMVVWTLFVALGDNVIRPWLIGFGVAMPISLVILGVFGGFLSFGFLGLFIGPVVLASALALLKTWKDGAP